MGRTAVSGPRLTCALLVIVIGTVVLTEQRAAGQRPSSPPGIERVNGRRAAAREVLVRTRSAGAALAIASGLDLNENEPVGAGLRRMRSRRYSTAELMATLNGRSDVLYAEPNYLLQIAAMPNDPHVTAQWAFREPLTGGGIDATGAWNIATGSRRFVVAVVDTGVDYAHPDLRANIWTAPSSFAVTIGGVSVSCPAGSHGFNAIAMTCDPFDTHGHGTRMAGVIGAVGNNGIGVSGVNWSANIMPLKFMNETGTGWTSDAVKALEFAIQVRQAFSPSGAADVRVLSNSWGGTGYSIALEEQVIRAGDHDMLVVASAGNQAVDTDLYPLYPASFDQANVLSVAATDEHDLLEPYSNYGALTVDIAAPGRGILSTQTGGGYSTGDGTSPAAAFASGSAALVLSHCNVSLAALRAVIVESVDVMGSLAGRTETSGRLNVGRAIRWCSNGNAAPFVELVAPADQQRFTAPASITIEADAYDADGTIARVDFFVGTTNVGSDTTAPYRITWNTSTAGTYAIRAMATDNHGATADTRVTRRIVVEGTTTLPSPWFTRDIGAVGAAGSAIAAGNGVTVEGAGADVWGTTDAFRFVYRALDGDGVITARVSSIETVDAWTKAGVMIRSALQADAAHAFMLVTPGKGLAFQRRVAAGGTSAHTAGPARTAPYWVRLERRGPTVLASSSPDGTSWTPVGQASIALGATAYVGVAVSSHRAGVLATAAFNSVTVTAPSVAPGAASGWSSSDVGAVGEAGAATESSGTFTVRGAGADVWGTSDAFHVVHRTLSGDGEIVARVASVQHVHAWTKAGVMIRQSLHPGSPHAFMMVTPGKGLAFQRRTTAGGLSVHTSGGAGIAPYWVRLTRQGQTITAYKSTDGVTWSPVGQDTLAISGPVYVGLAVGSHVAGTTATATFSNVTVR
ncbi:MAG TPA: S8 family serine peptidase [Vicinamibacterales bacterium]|nr:S8 family serine peptidase [Vicinamibacterales bacterium]